MSCSFNISKHKIGYYYELARDRPSGFTSAGLVVALLKVAQADATLSDHDTFAQILAAANTEADFTNYARKTMFGGTDAVITVDDALGNVRLKPADQTWVDAGGNPVVTNNSLVKVLVGFDPALGTGADSEIVPLTAHDLSATTDGNDLIVRFNVNGAARVT